MVVINILKNNLSNLKIPYRDLIIFQMKKPHILWHAIDNSNAASSFRLGKLTVGNSPLWICTFVKTASIYIHFVGTSPASWIGV